MKIIKLILLISFACYLNISYGQRTLAMQAYDSATHFRDAADSLWDTDSPPSKENLIKALGILNQGLDYLNQPLVWDLAQGNIYLKFRRFNILNDAAHIYSILRQKDSTIKILNEMMDIGGYNYEHIEKDTAFDFIRNEKDFKILFDDIHRRTALWTGSYFKTPFCKDLPVNEKIAGLSFLWSQAKYNFVHFDHAKIDWDKTYLDYLNQIIQTKTTAEYYKVLIKFYAALKDGHTNVYFPKELADSFYSRPPFRTELIENRVFVTDIYNDTLYQMGVEKGLELLSISGVPILDYAKRNIEPYQSSSTPQDMNVRKFTYGLLAGSKVEPLEIKFRNKEGKEWIETIPRRGYRITQSIPAIDYKEINDIGYLQLNTFDDDKIDSVYDSLFGKISKTKALIIDLRKNGGGSGDIGFHILSTLVNAPYAISSSRITQYNSKNFGEAQWFSYTPEKLSPSKSMFYPRPVILLISARTFSAAEDFVVAFSYMKRGTMIGQTTGGSTGQPLLLDLPGGGTARVCAKDDFFPDQRKFVGIGIAPDIYIHKSVKDLYANNDAALQKALELLK